jgi:hypothetical protein
MPPQVEYLTLAERACIKPYTRNDMLHMMLEMEYIMPVILVAEMYYLMHHFQMSKSSTSYVGSIYHRESISFYVGNR